MVQLSERFRLIDAIATIRNLEALTGVGVEERQDALAALADGGLGPAGHHCGGGGQRPVAKE
jgi:hypothetical protein